MHLSQVCLCGSPKGQCPPKSTYLPLDNKYLGERTNSDCFIKHTQWENSKIHIFHQDHKREDKAYNILSHFLHHVITTLEYLNKLNTTTEIKHMIRVTAEIKIYLMTW